MTKKLEEIFNLEDKKKLEEAHEEKIAGHQEVSSIEESYRAVTQITGDLPAIQELESLEEDDLDSLSEKAEQAYDDLMDLGMNVEVRYSGRIFEVASGMLKNAIDAKSAKIDRKLKAIDLQLKKLKIDKDSKPEEDTLSGEGYIISDRNELLKKLRKEE